MTHDDPFDPDDRSLNEEDIAEILDAYPSLGLIRPFIETARAAPWFTSLGEPPRTPVRDLARAYLDTLGFPDVEIAPVATWEDAADAAVSLDWDTVAWEAEEGLRAAVTTQAVDLVGEEAVELAMTYVASELTAPIRIAVQTSADLWNMRDTATLNAAAGSAIQACHLAALSLLAGQAGEDHPFTAKYELFEAGRWPVGIAGSSFNLF